MKIWVCEECGGWNDYLSGHCWRCGYAHEYDHDDGQPAESSRDDSQHDPTIDVDDNF